LNFGFWISDFGLVIQRMTSVDEETFKRRTRLFALAIIQLVESPARTNVAQVIGKQLLRSGTSVGANYRDACRGKSALDVMTKLGIVEEETDESLYWLELLVGGGLSQRIVSTH
jgi:four helix bundle protein